MWEEVRRLGEFFRLARAALFGILGQSSLSFAVGRSDLALLGPLAARRA
jgi:hypothetical protein